uniref:Maf-like protein n=1 Tax=Tetraselmis chuii TaxID=63592 RepID=A0A7S1SGM0_9CHLO|mmetsp:Transcript_107/g.183  ORF Transcript_107/g.183 Transcript_107/m.183 type:complete len:220 (+) Transcript_107:179-838(+)
MLLEHLPLLRDKRIVLASASPRRKELLELLGLRFEVKASSFDEDLPHANFRCAGDYAAETATHKAIDVARQTSTSDQRLADVVIGSDTVVEFQGEILEKPADAEDAFRVLSKLSGNTNRVHTGVVIVLPNVPDPKLGTPPFIRSFSETTEVEFAELSPALIRAYIQTGEPFGKAGSYGIQGTAGSFVRGLKGDYFNVMGFPIHRFSVEMAALVREGLIK